MRGSGFSRIIALVGLATIVLCVSSTSWATTVKKNISKDTVWRAKKSPYVVKEDILLEEGATLEIEPGVRVELAADKGIQVRGKLVAVGTPEEPIVFTAHDKEPWKSIYFTDFCPDAVVSESGAYVDGTVMKHCIVEKGHGVYIRFGAPLIAECKIRGNLSSGIRVEYGAPRLVGNRIYGNSTRSESASGNGGGIIAYTDKPVLIADNIIHNNVSHGGRDGGGGVHVYAVDGARVVVRNNIIFGNTSSRFGGGIYAYGALLEDNTVIGNEAVERGGGIYAVESRIADNLVQSNTSSRGGGIYAESGDVISNSIVRNAALRPEGGALYYFGSDDVLSNSLVSNTAGGEGGCGGIYVSGNPTIKGNNVINNSGYALHVANVANAPIVSAAGNFWGAASKEAVLNLTFDWLDDETTGLAGCMPFLDKMAPEAPRPPPFNLTATAGKDSVQVSWDEPTGAVSTGAVSGGHRIYLGSQSGYPYDRVIDAGPENKCEITGLKPGNEYWVTVSAYGAAEAGEAETGLSEAIRIAVTGSAESVARPKNLSPPDNESGVSKGITLKASRPGAGVVGSRWQISSAADDFLALTVDEIVSEGDPSGLDVASETLTAGQKYFWRVAFHTASGSWSEWSEPTSFATAPQSPSVLSGPISSAVKLEKKFSPYVVTGNTLVTPEGTLEVAPGVEIRVAAGKNIMIAGKLVARGTEAEPIRFTKRSSEKWGRIIFTDQSADSDRDEEKSFRDGCAMERCIVEHGKGLLIESSSPLIKDCVIAYNDGSGIAVRHGGPVITGNDIHHNSAPTNGGGVYAYTNDIIYVVGNNIRDNRADGAGGGVFAYGYMNTSAIRVENNEIVGNEATGDGGGIYLSRSSAVGNRVESNTADGDGGGIYSTFGLVDKNEIHKNRSDRGGAIFAEHNSSLTGNYATANRAASGFGGGIYINFWGASIENEAFTGNTVTGNEAPTDNGNGGVFIVGYMFFEQNNIHGNVGSQLYNGNESGSYDFYAADCYWGTASKEEISKLIVDGDDDPQLSKVTFEPFSADPFKFD